MDPADLLSRYGDRVTHVERVPAREAVVEPWPDWVSPPVRAVFEAEGATELWAHQAEGLRLVHDGRHVVVSTGTASGKSLVFQVPALEALSGGRSGSALHGHRSPTVLYLAPTKALAADQRRRLHPAADLVRAATVDGDNSRDEREWARDHADYALTNPDTLHHSILPAHARWTRLLGGLRYVVVDECHHYRGVFGAHVAHVLRRLRRVCAHYGADPVFILSSATVAEPADFARRLTGLDVVAVTDDASPHAARTIALWEPPLIGAAHPTQPPHRRSATTEAAEILTDLVVGGTRTLVFVRSRRGAEAVAAGAQRRLDDVDPSLVAHRGHLPRRLPARGAARARAATARRRPARPGEHQRARARHRHGRARRGRQRRVPRHPGRACSSSSAGPGGPARSRSACWWRATNRSTRSSCTIPRRCSVHPSRRRSSTRTTRTCWGRTSPRRRRSCRSPTDDLELFGPRAADGIEALEAAGWLRTTRGRLVLDPARPRLRPRRPPLQRRRAGADRRRRHRPSGRHGRRRVGRLHGAHRRRLRAPGRGVRRRRLRRRGRRGRGAPRRTRSTPPRRARPPRSRIVETERTQVWGEATISFGTVDVVEPGRVVRDAQHDRRATSARSRSTCPSGRCAPRRCGGRSAGRP